MKDFLIRHFYPPSRLGVGIRYLLPSRRPEWWLVRQVVSDLSYYRDDIIALQSESVISGIQNIWMVDRNCIINHIDHGGIGMIQPIPDSLILIPIRQEFIPGDDEKWDEWREDTDKSESLLDEFEVSGLPSDGDSPEFMSVEDFESLDLYIDYLAGDRVKIWDWKMAVRDRYHHCTHHGHKFDVRDAVRDTLDLTVEGIFEGLLEYEQGNPTYFHQK